MTSHGVAAGGGWRAPDARSRWREGALIAGLVAVLYLDAAWDGGNGIGLASVPAVALLVTPLLWRSRAPLRVLAVVLVATFACLLTLDPHNTVVLPAMVAVYAFAKQSDRTRAIAAGVLGVLVAVAAVIVFADDEPNARYIVLFNCVLVALSASAGDAARARRDVREAVQARERDREREHEARARQRVAEERLRIARDVHDVLAHAIMAINIQAGTAAHLADRDPAQARTALRDIKRSSGAALRDLRGALGLLRGADESSTSPSDGLATLSELIAPLRAAGIEASLQVEGPSDRVPSAIGASVFRIVQEASTNIVRHSGARHAAVRISIGASDVDVLVEDDGAGPAVTEVDASGSGNGVRGMIERAALVGGRLDAGSVPGGWRVHATLPMG